MNSDIIYRKWTHPAPRAVLLLIHGISAHMGRWEFLASFFLKNDFSSYALALRGFGETKGLKGHVDSFDIYFKDIRWLYDIIVKENPGKKVFILGESLGGLISFIMASRNPGLFDGLICISPAFKTKLKAPLSEYAEIFLACLFNPKKQFNVPFTSDMCTRDKDYQKVMDKDPRETRIATAKLLFEMLRAQIKSGFLKNKLETPVLFLLSGKDKLVNPLQSRKIFKHLVAGDKTLLEYPEMYHALSIDAEKERVFADILKWIEKRV